MSVKSGQLAHLYRQTHEHPSFEPLRLHRSKFVPGDGNTDAKVMIVGEAPGELEDRLQRPFVGPSGKLLDVLLCGVGIERGSVFVTNVIKYRPQANRAPVLAEVNAARPFLQHEIDVVDPRVVVLLGRTALSVFLPGARVNAVHGRPFHRQHRIFLPAYHPSAALREGSVRTALEADFQMLGRLLAGLKRAR